MSTKVSARMARWYGSICEVRVVIWRCPAVQSTVFDITERKQQKRPCDREERFHRVEGSIQGIMLHRDGKPIFANQAYAEMYGYDSPGGHPRGGEHLPRRHCARGSCEVVALFPGTYAG